MILYVFLFEKRDRVHTCHNHTANLRLYDTHFTTTSELSQFVFVSPTAKRRMLELLASVLREGFRKRGQSDLSEFVLASPTAKRRMLEPLVSILREGFRKQG